MDYKVHINESGAQYDETIEVDTEKQTEIFKVPPHNNVDQSNILYDFKTVSLPKVNVNFTGVLNLSKYTRFNSIPSQIWTACWKFGLNSLVDKHIVS